MTELPETIDEAHAESIAEAFQYECEQRWGVEVVIGSLGQAVAYPHDYDEFVEVKSAANAHGLTVIDEYGAEPEDDDRLVVEVEPDSAVRK